MAAIESLNDLDWSDKMYDGWRQVEKTITFTGGTANTTGDYDGTGDPFDIFTVTGTVLVKVIGICTTNLAGASAAISIGTETTAAGIIASTTATDIVAGEIWHDASPDAQVEAATVMAEKIVSNSNDIVGSIATANITAGVLKFICLWKPISSDGNVVAA